jgi:membrane protein required for colicin V production
MAWVDWAVLAILVVCTLGGLAQGFFRTIFSLGGLIFGLLLAAWNYEKVAMILKPVIRADAIANTVGFLIIALLVMVMANLAGGITSRTIHWMGLGCLDKAGGAVLGFLQGLLLVMVCILVIVAFFPEERWLAEARLPRMFFGACHVSTDVTPAELSERVRNGLRQLEHGSPEWMHPGNGSD